MGVAWWGKHTIKRGQLKVSAIQFLMLRKLPKINSGWDWDAPHVSIFHLQIIKCRKLPLQTHVNACLKGTGRQNKFKYQDNRYP